MRMLSNGFDEDLNAKRAAEVVVFCDPEEDRAVQADRDDADINVIIRRYNASGIPPRSSSVPYFADATDGFDLHTAMQVVRDAMESFEALPSDVRSQFANDPVQLLRFLEDPGNRYQAAKLGLLRPEVAKEILSPRPNVVVEPPKAPILTPDAGSGSPAPGAPGSTA